MPKETSILLLFCLLIFSSPLKAQEISVGDITGVSFNLQTEATNIHYKIFGEGEPLMVLHGNGGSSESIYRLLPQLVEDYRVIAVDHRCHGQSGCPDQELNYEIMAEDISQLMLHLEYDDYNIWGHSDGGIIGLILGYTHPEKIDRMLISGANTRPDSSALQPEIVALINRYDEIPDPELRKKIKLMAYHPNIRMSKISQINVPVTLLVGDRDAVRIEHTIEIFRALPQANLCVLPGTSHFIENPDLLVDQIKELKQPFTSHSTVKVAEMMAKQLFETEN